MLEALADWQAPTIEAAVREFATAGAVKLGDLAQPLRAAVTGQTTSPPIFEVMEVLGRDEALGRLTDAIGAA
jgi:glutamyl-tRNA synthetase